MRWDTWRGLNSYDTDNGEFVYEHDVKLYDRNLETRVGAMGHEYCDADHWVGERYNGDTTWVVGTDMPNRASVYADTARASDDCDVFDVSFGIFNPEVVRPDTTYRVVLGGAKGEARRSAVEMQAWKNVDECPPGWEWQQCVSQLDYRSKRMLPLIGDHRNWKFPGCYTWRRHDSPTKEVC